MKKKLLFLLTAIGLVGLVGCNNDGGETSSMSDSTSGDSSQTSTPISEEEVDVMEKFKDVFDSLGMNYVVSDYFYSYDETYPSYPYSAIANQMVVTENSVFNFNTKSGYAKHKNGRNTEFYAYGVAFNGADIEFMPSYHPVQGLPYGAVFSDETAYLIAATEANYNAFYTMPTVDELAEANGLDLEEDFVPGEDDEGNLTLTSVNPYVGLMMFDNSIANTLGYGADEYYYDFMNALDETKKITTVITLIEYGDFNDIYWEVYLDNFGPLDKGGNPTLPILVRDFVPLDGVDQEILEEYGFETFVPDDFYTNGPGEESEASKATRKAFADKVTKLKTGQNYDLTHKLTDSSGTYTFDSRMVGKDYTEFGSLSGSNPYKLGYINVQFNEDKSNTDTRGIHYYNPTAEETTDDPKHSEWLSLQDAITMSRSQFGASNVTVDADGYNIHVTTTSGAKNDVNLDEFINSMWENYMNKMVMLDNTEYKALWNNVTGGNWEDGVFISESGHVHVTNYFIVSALTTTNLLLGNILDGLTLEFNMNKTGEEDPDALNAEARYFTDGSGQGEYGWYIYGDLRFHDVGKTKASYEIGTYANTTWGLSIPTEDAPSVTD